MNTTSKKMYYQDRTYATVLKRIEHILETQKNHTHLYKDEDFKVFWKPDSESSKCYDCALKFNYFRRRHHCRICGQIFCYYCCNKTIPGKLLGSLDSLKSCTFCCKILLTQLHWNSVGNDMLRELKILQEQLIPRDSLPSSLDPGARDVSCRKEDVKSKIKRRFGFVEENIDESMKNIDERDPVLNDLHQLKYLWYLMTSGPNKLPLGNHRWRVKVYPDTFDGREFIKWLKNENMAPNHESAVAIGQAFLKAGYICCASHESHNFTDEFGIYKISDLENLERRSGATTTTEDQAQEPSWIKLIPSQSTDGIRTSNSGSNVPSPTKENWAHDSIATTLSNSSYSLDLNVEENVVSISKSIKDIRDLKDERLGAVTTDVNNSIIMVSASQQFASYSLKSDTGLQVLKNFDPIQAEDAASEWQNINISGSEMLQNDNIQSSRVIGARLNSLWKTHESSLFQQLLELNGLPASWGDVILPIAYKITNTVSPDVRHEGDLMDIRQYVNFKKVPGGQPKDCQIVNGTVCTKNVVRIDMRKQIRDPKILLISPAIDPLDQLDTAKLNATDAMMLEAEYTRRILPKLLSCKPNIIVCGSRVMFNAIEQFLEANVTVVMNMKKSVIQRVARCTTAQIVNCIDSELRVIPQFSSEKESPLGMCHSFYLRSYQVPHSQTQKTLMFFDGCATHSGCTVILRGGSNCELQRVKSVLRFTIYALHNWKLERSFLMDEMIFVPAQRETREDKKSFLRAGEIVEDNSCISDSTKINQTLSNEIESKYSESSEMNESEEEIVCTSTRASTPEKTNRAKCVVDGSDPLQAYFKDDLLSPSEGRKISSSVLTTRDATFRKALESTVLSVSPLVLNQLPFLESDVGRRCTTRMFFPDNLYYSFALQPGRKRKFSDHNLEIPPCKSNNVEFKEPHTFVSTPIVSAIKGPAVKSDLSNYRARGCRIRNVCKCNKNKYQAQKYSSPNLIQNVKTPCITNANFVLMPEGMVDAFHLYNHQQLAMHHFIFAQSNKDTQLCIQPRLMNINFYGIKDYPLGDYLEKYCFDVSRKCRSCKREFMNLGQSRNSVIHVMKFIHGKGSVEIVLKKLDHSIAGSSPHSASTIYMWTSCQICNQNSSVVPMATETWAFSFGKFMELLFYDHVTTRRDQTVCSHSLHQDHAHYFAQRDVVAVFRYSPISVKNLFIPPPEIEYVHVVLPKITLVEEMKMLSVEGHNILSKILSLLDKLLSENSERGYKNYVCSLVQQYQILVNTFKSEVGKIQLQLTSKSYVTFADDVSTNQQLAPTMYDILDQLVFIKRMIIRIIQDWNDKVQDLCQKKKESQKVADKSKSPSFLDSKRNKVTPQECDNTCESASTGSIVNVENAPTEVQISAEEKRKSMVRSSSNPEASNDPLSVRPKQTKPENPNESDLGSSESYRTSLSSSSGSCFTSDVTDLSDQSSREESARMRRLYSSSEAVISDYIRPGPKQFISFKSDAEEMPEKEKQGYGQSFKAIFSNLFGSLDIDMIKYPFPASEHYNLLPEVSVPVVIYDDEPSSIIAKALSSQEYQKNLQLILQQHPHKRQGSWEGVKNVHSTFPQPNVDENPKHIALQWNDVSTDYYCKIFFADRFHDLRQLIFPTGEEVFVRSLSRCANWEAKGGKSGSLFCKTRDDRFVLKEISDKEMASMDTFAPSFIQYLIDRKKSNRATVFARIIGIYRIAFKNNDTDKVLRRDLLVMENLFYQRSISHKYDLKGALRNREAKVEELEETEVVLLDKNLLKMACSSQFYLRPQGKTVLTRAIDSDTEFLKKHEIMDYSLVMGFDEESNELVVGIVDYIRPFTFDKKMEFAIKQFFMYPSKTNEKPTIVSPENYRKRFCEAMEKYFAFTPDKWVGLASPTFDLI